MSKIAIMTDTNSGILPEQAVADGIHLLQMPFFVDDEEFLEYGSMGYMEFFERLSAGSRVSTSQPSPGALCDMWDSLLESFGSVIYLPMSSGLSGTCKTAQMLADDYNGRVLVVDNKRISVTLRASVYAALQMAAKGIEAEEIVSRIESASEDASVYLAVNTLEHLKKGGRITAAGAAIGSLLGIKPVLKLESEKLDAYKKVRGMPSAIEAMLEAVETDLETKFYGKKAEIRVAYAGHKSLGLDWQTKAQERFTDYEIGLDALPVSISCHVGPGAIGIGVYAVE